jgi:peroxiredoxin Q/BCP
VCIPRQPAAIQDEQGRGARRKHPRRSEQARFAEKYELPFPLLADADHAVAEKYGVWQKKSMYGRSFMGIARTTYLIDGSGKVVQRWDNVKVPGHAEAVLEAVQELS